MSVEVYTPIKIAAEFLASRCDYAQEEDGVGYNKSDAGLGHRLAALPIELWTAEELFDIHKRLRKYRDQLAGGGIMFSELPKPINPDDDQAFTSTRRAAVESRRRERVEIIGKAANGATLSKEDKKIQAEIETAAKTKAARFVKLAGQAFEVAFPYHAEMVATLKAIPGRKQFQGAARSWLLQSDVDAAAFEL